MRRFHPILAVLAACWEPVTAIVVGAGSLLAMGQEASAPAEVAPAVDAATGVVEISNSGDEEGAPFLGVVVGPNQVVTVLKDKWATGTNVRSLRSGVEGAVTGVLNWGGEQRLDWIVLEVEWEDNPPQALRVVSEEPTTGSMLRVTSWRDGDCVQLDGPLSNAPCSTCARSIPFTADDQERVLTMRRGAPVTNEAAELVGLLQTYSVGVSVPSFQSRRYVSFIPESAWRIESMERVTEERFTAIFEAQSAVGELLVKAQQKYQARAYREAVDAALEALSLDPNQGEAWFVIGHSMYLLKQYRSAEDALHRAAQRGEERVHSTAIRSAALAHVGDLTEAVELALWVEREGADDLQSLRGAAWTLKLARQPESAERVLRRILQLDPDDKWAARTLESLK